ncbi:hypothetical protein [Kitasatospora sp. NPDC094015]|uniref:hypothetical protein n=1 Tax=Kitasatospora sp. NPDC094015 TaxID=3155205 RepID=UPI00332F52BF
MRRTAALLITPLLAGTAALTVPTVAQAQGAPSAPTSGQCVAYTSGPFGVGVCSGLEPRRAWSVSAKCMSGITVSSGLQLGDRTATAWCGNSQAYSASYSIGPILP